MKNWGFLLLVFIPSLAYARTDCTALATEVAPAFLQTLAEDYRPLLCSDNVLSAARRLKAGGVSLEGARVVVLRHIGAPYMGVQPLRPKLTYKNHVYKPVQWSFHVFFVVDGLVFDMDYTDRPQALGIEEYFKTMWLSEELEDYVFQVKPLADYGTKDTFGVFQNETVFSGEEWTTVLGGTSCFRQTPIYLVP